MSLVYKATFITHEACYEMTIPLYVLFLCCILASAQGQSSHESTAIEFDLYQFDGNYDSLSCEEGNELRVAVIAFNRKQLRRAWEVADSINKVYDPCYFYTVQMDCNERLRYFSADENCIRNLTSTSDVMCINSKIRLERVRRFKIFSSPGSGTVFCDEELFR